MPTNKRPNIGGHPMDTTPEHTARREAHGRIKEFNRKWGSLIGGLRSKDIVDPSHISEYITEREQLDIPEGFDRKMLPPKISPQTHISAKQRWEQHQQKNKQPEGRTLDYSTMKPEKQKEAPTLDYGKMNQVSQKEPERTFSWDKIGRVRETLGSTAPERQKQPRVRRLEESMRKTEAVIASLKKSEKKKKPFKGYNKKRHARTGGLNDKAREKMNREEGSNLKRPVTEKNPTGKDAARRKSFCARMSGVKGPTSKDGELTPKGAALKRWRCGKSMEKSKERCWDGYEPVPGKEPYSKGSCVKKSRELLKTYKSTGKWKVAGEVPNSPEMEKTKGVHPQYPGRPQGTSDAGDANVYWRTNTRQAQNPKNSPQERMIHRGYAGRSRAEARGHHERVLNEIREMPKPNLPKSMEKTDLAKGPYLKQGSKLGQELYDETQNIERKKTRTGREAQGAGIRAEQLWGGKAGYRTGKQQAEMQAKRDRAKSKQNPVRTLADLSIEEKSALEAQYGARKSVLAKTKELLMKPPKSEAQRRFMGAVKAGKVPNVPKEVGEEFLEDDSGKKLPEKVEKAKITASKIGKKDLPEGLGADHKKRLSREYRELHRQAKAKGEHKDARVFAERSKRLSEESRPAGAAKPLSSS